MRLRQIALAASDLEPTVDLLTDVLGIEVGFRDPGVAEFGLVNAVMPVGETFLEVVTPARPDAAAQRWIDRRGGDAGYMAIFQCDDHDAQRAAVATAVGAGAKTVWEGEHKGGRGTHLHPRGFGAIVSFDAMPSWEAWVWGGPDWREHVSDASAITGAELAGPDPDRLASHWASCLGATTQRVGVEFTIDLPRGGRLRFVASDRGEGLTGVEFRFADRAHFESRAEARGVLGADGSATIAGTRMIPFDC